MAKDIQLKKADGDIFADQGASWMALDLPEVKPPLYSKAFILFLTGFLFTAVTYSALTKVPVVIESGGKLATSKPAVPIRAHFNFTVNSLRVKENQLVKVGDILASSDEGFTPEELTLVKDLETGLNYINSQQPMNQCANCAAVVRQVNEISTKLAKSKMAGSVVKPITISSQNLVMIIDKLAVAEKKMQPFKTRIASMKLSGGRQPASAAASSTPGSAKEIQKIQGQIDQVYTTFNTAIQKNRAEILGLSKTTLSNLEEISKVSGIRAPVEGKIVNIKLKGAGEMVGAGQPVMEIIPTDHQLIAAIDVQNKDIGAIQVGDPVEISVDAYPEMDYGVLKGQISEILPMDGSEAQGPYGAERGFKVRVQLNSQELRAGKETLALLPGMTIRARTIKHNETLLKKFYRTIFHMKEDLRVQRS